MYCVIIRPSTSKIIPTPLPYMNLLTTAQKNYNYHQSRARMVVENAFGRLKCRWLCLLKRMDFQLENVPNAVSACVVLRNLCEQHGDECSADWIENTDELSTSVITQCSTVGSTPCTNAHQVRDAIMQYLVTH